MMLGSITSICVAAACVAGCGANQPTLDPFAEPAQCSSGRTRSINESEGAEMGPGRACIGCHADSNVASGEQDAPIFAFAGTAYPTAHEPIDCIGEGSQGAEVEITDAIGKVWLEIINAAGNFHEDGAGFSYPYRAKIRFQGRERAMQCAVDWRLQPVSHRDGQHRRAR